ncbi:MAG: hypothetical protein ACFFCE_07470 [Promethearchaeota archaeon]
MNNIIPIKQRLKVISLISIVLFTSVYAICLINISNSLSKTKELNEVEDGNNLNIKLSGTHPWWNTTFRSRQVINITNPYSVDFENYSVSISFIYNTYVSDGRMNKSLKDIRIIEYDSANNPHIRKYYFQKNYPSPNIATVWFDTNISASSTEYDTYLYYGNDEVEIDTTYFMNESSASAADNFGWIRNGNFEQDIVTGTKINNTFGWYYADDVPDDLNVPYTPTSMTPDYYQHNLSNSLIAQEHVEQGSYAFKWGDISHDVSSGGIGDDIVGTLFSYPFKVPKVTGGRMGINAWRNIRMYDSSKSKVFGYFVRIATTYSENVNLHEELFNVELWDSLGEGTKVSDLPTWAGVHPSGTPSVDTAAISPGLTGYINIDLSDYEGLTVFLEFGIYTHTDEFAAFSAFGQVDDVRFNYTLQVDLDSDIEERRSEVTVIVKDIDGRIVPNAEVSLVNYSLPDPIIDTQNTSTDEGSAVFTDVDYKTYDIVVNYTIEYTGNETVVYNSSEGGGSDFKIYKSIHSFDVKVDLWTIDFEIVDYGKEPLNYGYIEVNYTKGGGFLDNLTLNSDGKATFRWINKDKYYYKVFYDNPDYNLNPTALNESWITRANYDIIGDKIQQKSVSLNETIPWSASPSTFTVDELFYTNGSRTELGNKKIISAEINVTAPRGSTTISSISVYYIDKNNYTNDNYRVYYNNTAGEDLYRIQIDMRAPPEKPSSLAGDKYEVYGLKIVTTGINSSNVWGKINVSFNETCNIYNVTDLCKLNIKIIDAVGAGVSGCLIKVNSTNRDGLFNVTNDLLTRDFTGYAYGQINTELPLWYLRGFEYNFSLVFFGSHKNLIVNKSDQTFQQGVNIPFYNYTLKNSTELIFEIFLGVDINASDYQTKFKDLITQETVIWDQDITIQVNFSLTEDGWDTSEPVTLPANVFCTIKTTGPGSHVVLELEMNPQENGIFDYTFDSAQLSAGERGRLYSIIISGNKVGYSPPTNLSDSIFIDTIPTNITMHDYYNNLTEITNFSQIFGEMVNLTVKYYNSFTEAPLKGAVLTYEWLNLDPIQFFEDPINDGYYTATINTTIAEVWGTKSIEIIAKNENHTSQTLYTSLNINERITTLNGETDLVYINSKVWVEDPNPFEFFYQDEITEAYIGNLTTATYTWEELYANGTRIPGIHGSGTLFQNNNNTLILDFKTEIRSVGYYYLYVTLQKQNYKAKSALINLEIMLRNFEPTIESLQLGSNNQIQIEHGTDVDFEISLWDTTRDIELEGATIKFAFRGVNHTFDPSDTTAGLYTLTLITSNIDTFLSERTFVGKIYIEADNFTRQEITVTITVNMEEIFPGMPSFYFILITASIIGILGSLVAYRVIQQARIPKHVKKIRKVKGLIKSKKKITEIISVPSKAEMIAKLFGDDWKQIDLSIEKSLGIEELKKKLPIKDKLKEQRGDIE